MLSLRGVQKVFNQGQINENHALRNINITINQGDFITVIGSNGAGKSTLLNIIAGSYPVEAGRIMLGENDITRLPAHSRAAWIGRVFQDPMMGTASEMTIEENLSLALRRGKRRGLRLGVNKDLREKFCSSLAQLDLGLEERLQEKVSLLSGGQRQALTLLMATFGGPEILLLDEHTASLDPQTAAEIISLTNSVISDQQLTVMMVTHDMGQALEMGNRTIMMDKAEIILDVSDPGRNDLSIDDLLQKFAQVRGKKLMDDRLLLG